VNDSQFSKSGFLRTYLLPVAFVVVIPAVGWWFSNHAIGSLDAAMREDALSSIAKDTSLDAAARERATAFYQANPVSAICRGGTPQLDELAAGLEDLCSDYSQLFWMRRIGIACLAIGLLAFLFASGCVAVSLASQQTLYVSFLAGWHVLKVASLLQAICQGLLAVGLSYWMTALWFESYYPKLILIAALAALAAIALIVKAIFKRIDATPSADGVLIAEASAPRFWAHVREMCRKVGTEPPAQIVAGVDDNFFVTENPLSVNGQLLEGRTLFVSFSLLKFMEKLEADAVLAHEMAHFSGQDTLFTKKMTPLLSRYVEYLRALHEGGLSRPIFHFMLFFWALFHLSINRMSRLREFRADKIAADATSPAHMGRALIKVSAYSSYRNRIEQALFSENARRESLDIAGRVSAGFSSYVASSNLLGDLGGVSFPHPFDSHPPLNARLAAVRAPIVPSHYPKMLTAPVAETWLTDIDDAAGMEQRLWQAYEERFTAAHEESLAWRYLPETEEERTLVAKYFPPETRATKKQDATLLIDFERVCFSEWELSVGYGDVASCEMRESLGRKFLTLKLTNGRPKVEIPLHRFAEADGVVNTFQRYYARHMTVMQHRATGGDEASAA
jgi:Zn-dependent protease with chaperone function